MDQPRFRLSSYLHWIELAADRYALYHLNFGRMVDAFTIELLRRFETPRRVMEVVAEYEDPQEVASILAGFYERTFLIPENADEAAFHRARLTQRIEAGEGIGGSEREGHYVFTDSVNSAADLATSGTGQTLKMAIIGTCVWQELTETLEEEARKLGLDLQISTEAQVDFFAHEGANQYDAVFLSPMSFQRFLDAPSLTDVADAVTEGLQSLSQYVKLLTETTGSTVVLHNLPEPAYPGWGASEATQADGHRALYARINQGIACLCDHQKVLLFDWDRAVARHGRLKMQDGHLSLYSHLGYPIHWLTDWADFLAQRENNETLLTVDHAEYLAHMGLNSPYDTHRITARELARFLRIAFGQSPRKVVVVDLDGTLWPGVLAEENHVLRPDWEPGDATALWAGIHQALKFLKRRGVLLCTCSKNNPEVILPIWSDVTLDKWRTSWMLTPDDFVAHEISWDPKTEALERLSERLSLDLNAFVFIDDNPIERAQVKHVLPMVDVYDGPMYAVRQFLMEHPDLQTLHVSDEAAQRTEMSKGQLKRDDARKNAASLASFFETLGVQIALSKVHAPRHVVRIHGLLTRCNQLNTRTRRYTRAEVESLVETAEVFTAQTTDRFVEYGTTTVIVVVGARVEHFVSSCRSNGLGVERAALGVIGREKNLDTLEVVFERTAKNRPMLDLLESLGTCVNGVYHVPVSALDPGHVTTSS